MMDVKIVVLIILSVFASGGQTTHFGRVGGGRRVRIPEDRCPRGSPLMQCLRNPCHGNTRSGCPNYPNAVCINDNPCEPWCIGHYYTGRQRRLTRQECFGEELQQTDALMCPPSRLRCFANPCDVGTCPSYPNARCVNDDPCEPFCIGHFYDGDRLITRRQCRRNRRRNRHY